MKTPSEYFKKIEKIGGRPHWSQDLYHYLMVISWPRFFLIFVIFFISFNSFFGFLYWIVPDTVAGTDHSFWQAFLFSIQTYSTIGYGIFYPNSNWAHVLVVLESILTIFFSAALTGLVFAKFSRPSAKILFSKNVLINQFEGKPTLMMRMGNLRDNQISEARVRLIVLKSVRTSDGRALRRQFDLKLVRDSSLFFALSWLVLHEIDEKSPLFGITQQQINEQNISIGVSVTGVDSTFSQPVMANCLYTADDFVFDKYFVDVIESEGDQILAINYEKFHDFTT